MATPGDVPIVPFSSQDDWRAWLDEHHADSPGVWIKMAKKASGIASVTHAEALDHALCYGWIDGQRNSFDDTWFLQRFTPRRPKSKWSQINRDKVADLTERGLMRPAGLREVERAKADGRWEAAYPSQRNLTVPDDLRAALDANGAAREAFAIPRPRQPLRHPLPAVRRQEAGDPDQAHRGLRRHAGRGPQAPPVTGTAPTGRALLG